MSDLIVFDMVCCYHAIGDRASSESRGQTPCHADAPLGQNFALGALILPNKPCQLRKNGALAQPE